MNKIKLAEAINTFEEYVDFYNYVNIKNESQTNNFDEKSYFEIIYLSLYLYHVQKGIHTLSEKISIPELFSRKISYAQFKIELEKYKDIKYSDNVTNMKNLYQKILSLANFKLLDRGDWTKIYSSSITQKDFSEIGKLYVSVDNSYLYQFAFDMLTSCLKNGIYDYEFKVNNNYEINRTDNMVIYFTKDNLNKYLSIINDLKQKYPNFAINCSHILGKEISEGVAIAKDYKDGSSFTEKICKTCLGLKKNGYSTEKIVELVERSVNTYLESVISLISEEQLGEHKKL